MTGKHKSPQESLAGGCLFPVNPHMEPEPCYTHQARGMGGQHAHVGKFPPQTRSGGTKGGRADNI